jgi:uncharacterized protein YjbI with pentapeptide repeats
MANQEHVDLLKQGVEQWNQWRNEHPEIHPDLTSADLTGADLIRANFWGTDFQNANLSGADLRQAYLYEGWLMGAKLIKANLNYANLSRADLSRANLKEAILNHTNLLKADLKEAILDEADLTFVNLREANLVDADLLKANLKGAHLYRANLSRANLSGAFLASAFLSDTNLTYANLSGAFLIRTNLSRTILVKTNFANAILEDCDVYGISAWDIQLEGTLQINLRITEDHQPTITVDDLEVAQFIYLLLNHQKLRNVLNAVTERGVLLLGRFGGGGLEVLQAVAAKLREEKYLPIIFDFDRPSDRNFVETVKTLVGLSRFIIADLSGPSVPLELYATVPHFKVPFVPILEAGRKPFSMAPDLLEYPWVIRPPVIFASIDELVSLVPSRIIAPAEERHRARQQLLDELFRPK